MRTGIPSTAGGARGNLAQIGTCLYNQQAPSQLRALLGNRQERIMTGSGSLQGSSGDALDDATRHLRALAALLMRLFEALATLPADSQPISNGSRPTEVDVWAGLHDVMADLLCTSQEIQRLIDGLRPHAGEPATSQIGRNGDGDGDGDTP